MKTLLIGSMSLLLLFSWSAVAEPLAPLAKLDGRLGELVKPVEREVPDASRVGIPVYPGSLFCTIDKGKWGKTGWSEVQLRSTASYEKVVGWYREKMDGWYCHEWAKGITSSCSDKDPGPAGNYDSETFNVVKILKTTHPDPCDVPGMQTRISIRFQPD